MLVAAAAAAFSGISRGRSGWEGLFVALNPGLLYVAAPSGPTSQRRLAPAGRTRRPAARHDHGQGAEREEEDRQAVTRDERPEVERVRLRRCEDDDRNDEKCLHERRLPEDALRRRACQQREHDAE